MASKKSGFLCLSGSALCDEDALPIDRQVSNNLTVSIYHSPAMVIVSILDPKECGVRSRHRRSTATRSDSHVSTWHICLVNVWCPHQSGVRFFPGGPLQSSYQFRVP